MRSCPSVERSGDRRVLQARIAKEKSWGTKRASHSVVTMEGIRDGRQAPNRWEWRVFASLLYEGEMRQWIAGVDRPPAAQGEGVRETETHELGVSRTKSPSEIEKEQRLPKQSWQRASRPNRV